MNNEFSISGTKIIMRRLFKYDIDEIINSYKEYDKLFYNPISKNFLKNVLLYGEIWGAFFNNKLIGCNYFFPLHSDFFKDTDTYSSITDFINEPSQYLYMGYVAMDNEYSKSDSMYKAFLNIVQIQAFRQGYKYILHSMPIKMSENISALFSNDYILIKIRGLDYLVVHYIFVKSIFYENSMYNIDKNEKDIQLCMGNTKAISKLLENGYCAVNIENNPDGDNIIIKKLV